MLEIICARTATCTFRVHADYFKDKVRFTAGICPNCGGPVHVVEEGTDNHIEGYTFVKERGLHNYGAIIPVNPA